jgi:hypothetical protein
VSSGVPCNETAFLGILNKIYIERPPARPQEAFGDSMQIFLKELTERHTTCQVEPTDQVADVKKPISRGMEFRQTRSD